MLPLQLHRVSGRLRWGPAQKTPTSAGPPGSWDSSASSSVSGPGSWEGGPLGEAGGQGASSVSNVLGEQKEITAL